MTDRIYIRDLALRCIVGIFPEERRAKQDVIINLTLETDLRLAARSDRIEDTVDYKKLKGRIVELVEASSFQLIETLADRIATICLGHPGVRRATVCVDKPAALRFARSVAVEITRTARTRKPTQTPAHLSRAGDRKVAKP
ncbi:MAG: dihydroneopterin aldolase [Kiritimatiellia bacterium]|nr:dihydroneopterin aldolase [Kiritimatiellia bacterium]